MPERTVHSRQPELTLKIFCTQIVRTIYIYIYNYRRDGAGGHGEDEDVDVGVDVDPCNILSQYGRIYGKTRFPPAHF